MNVLAVSSSMKDVYLFLKYKDLFLNRIIKGKNSGSFIAFEIDNLLKEAHIDLEEIDYYGIDVGPGSFTGIRVSIAVMQGLLFDINKSNYANIFTSTEFIYQSAINLKQIPENNKYAVLKRARENAAYISIYENSKILLNPVMVEEKDIVKITEDCVLLGKEAELFKSKYNLNNEYVLTDLDNNTLLDLTLNGKKTSSFDLLPLYLQKPLAYEMLKNKL